MASPSSADEGSAENRIASLNQQHDDEQREYFPGETFNDVDGDDDGTINNLCADSGRPRFMDDGEGHESYSVEGEIRDDIDNGHQGGEHQRLDDHRKDGLGGERRGVDGDEYDDDVDGGWSGMQSYINDPPAVPREKQSDSAEGGGSAGGGIKRSFSHQRLPHEDDNGQHAHREPPGVGDARDKEDDETDVDDGGAGDGEMQRPSLDREAGFKQQQQQQRSGFLSGNKRPFRPGFREARSKQGKDDSASGRGGGGGGGSGGGGGGRDESVASPAQFDSQGQQPQSGASAFSESDAGSPSNDQQANPWNSKAGKGGSREEGGGEDEGEHEEEGGAEGQAQKRQRQQRRKHSELLVGKGFSAIARCYAAANCAIRGVEADQVSKVQNKGRGGTFTMFCVVGGLHPITSTTWRQGAVPAFA